MTTPTTSVGFADGESITYAFFDRWNARDPDAISELFVDDADFVNVVGFWWTSKRQIRKAHDYGFRRIFSSSRIQITELVVRTVSNDVHIVHTVSTLDGQRSLDSTPTETRTAVISMVAVRQDDGSFLLVSCHNTDRVDGADTHLRTQGDLRPADYRR